MSKVTIWHNPRCTKSRATLALLEDRGLAPHIIKYLDDAPSKDDIRHALKLLNIPAIDLVRTNETVFTELGLTADDADDKLIEAMHTHSKLIERPVVFANGKAAIGRPPENILEIL